jgi:cytochrome c
MTAWWGWGICAILAAVGGGFAGQGARKERETYARAAAQTGGDPHLGRVEIEAAGCGACHEIPRTARGTGTVGPSLEKIARRNYIAGVLSNSPEHMVRWLQGPPDVDPLTAMPDLHLSERQARDIAAFLYTLE